ncbi:nucleotide disphospho-sugar-binding domain-containing protein [Azospirillum sp.]|uniref:nucleotide disphospho-sugar-binding domain-containing protein n=1 Tax=Azospirillum sp. TaxID=34012 RepID=UPI002D4AC041|nr:nucleotide disphospho-sugar-binding domain-containing protein [Azospirillum sp.]HYD67262.1 nucleotide disphospho-sugar-binding domain-containing protein [Azospirillum sp.]
MARVLLAWEFGAGLGHLNRLIAVGRRLAEAGHAITVAVPRRAATAPIVERSLPGTTVLEGWSWHVADAATARRVPTHSFADVIWLFGYYKEDALAAAAERWRAVLAEVKPDLVIADFAPTLALVAGADLPRVVLGNGYTVPPPGRPLPPLRPWARAVPKESAAHERQLLDLANRLRRRYGQAPLRHFADLFSGPRTFVCTIPEFDPYGAHRQEPTFTPFNVPRIAAGPPVEARGDQPIALYLPANHPHLRDAFAAVADCNLLCHAYVSGMAPEVVAKHAPPNMAVHRKPLDLGTLLPKARALIHHAGLATAYAGLQAGVPQLVLPANLEHAITARGLEGFEAALSVLSAPGTPGAVEGALRRLLGERALWDAAGAAARAVGARPVVDSLAAVVAGCRDLLGN